MEVSKIIETEHLRNVGEMAAPSLSPDVYSMWLQVKWSLVINRQLRVEPTQDELDEFVQLFIESRKEQPYKWKFEAATATFVGGHIGIFVSHLDSDQTEKIMQMSTRKQAIAIILWSKACRKYLNAKLHL